MVPFKIGQKVKIVRGSVDKSIHTISFCSWRDDQTTHDPIPMKEHWKGKTNKDGKESDFIPLPLQCPSYSLDGVKASYWHFELEAIDE